MSDHLQEWLVYVITAVAALLLLYRRIRKNRGCQDCPVRKISDFRPTGNEPAASSDVGEAPLPNTATHGEGERG